MVYLFRVVQGAHDFFLKSIPLPNLSQEIDFAETQFQPLGKASNGLVDDSKAAIHNSMVAVREIAGLVLAHIAVDVVVPPGDIEVDVGGCRQLPVGKDGTLGLEIITVQGFLKLVGVRLCLGGTDGRQGKYQKNNSLHIHGIK